MRCVLARASARLKRGEVRLEGGGGKGRGRGGQVAAAALSSVLGLVFEEPKGTSNLE